MVSQTLAWRLGGTAIVLAFAFTAVLSSTSATERTLRLQDATPAVDPCAGVPGPGTPAMDHAGMEELAGTPMAEMEHDMAGAMVEFDQMYIDMMIPHHAAIIAMAEAALTRLTDERLREIAQAIAIAQEPEIEELRDYRERFYGSAEPLPMDQQMMELMDEMMPGMAPSQDEMMVQMDPEMQVALICAAEDPDQAFIEMTIAHHVGAVVASEAALEQAIHPEIEAFAERVIADQQREIAELTKIREDLYGEATPVARGA